MSGQYSYDHSIFTKDTLIWAHQEVMRRMKEAKKYSSYAELHWLFEERYNNFNTTCNGLRRAMVRMFDYDWQEFSRARSSKKLIFHMSQFMIRYTVSCPG